MALIELPGWSQHRKLDIAAKALSAHDELLGHLRYSVYLTRRGAAIEHGPLRQISLVGPSRGGGGRIAQRLQHAPDVHDLWHLRRNLMAALAAIHGEEAASLQVAAVNGMFDGFLPRGLKPRPSPLWFR